MITRRIPVPPRRLLEFIREPQLTQSLSSFPRQDRRPPERSPAASQAARKGAKTAAGRGIGVAIRHQHLASDRLRHVRVQRNVPEVSHLAVQKAFHDGIDLAENFVRIVLALHGIDQHVDVLFGLLHQDDLDYGISVDNRGRFGSTHDDDLLGRKQKMDHIAADSRRRINDEVVRIRVEVAKLSTRWFLCSSVSSERRCSPELAGMI